MPATDIHATGQPDTPVEVITSLLQQALQTSDSAASKDLVQQAYDVVSGLDTYLEAVSTPPSQVNTVRQTCHLLNCMNM